MRAVLDTRIPLPGAVSQVPSEELELSGRTREQGCPEESALTFPVAPPRVVAGGPALRKTCCEGSRAGGSGSVPSVPCLPGRPPWSSAGVHPVPCPHLPSSRWGSAPRCPGCVPLPPSAPSPLQSKLSPQPAVSSRPGSCSSVTSKRQSVTRQPRSSSALGWELGAWQQVPTGSSARGETRAGR